MSMSFEESPSSSTSQPKRSNGNKEADDPEKTMATVACFIEQIHANKSSATEKELKFCIRKEETKYVVEAMNECKPCCCVGGSYASAIVKSSSAIYPF